MSMSLSTALRQVELEAGRVYHCRVGRLHVEVRVEETASDLLPTPLEASDVMLDPWDRPARPAARRCPDLDRGPAGAVPK